MAKLLASEGGSRVVDRAMQIHGGYGVTKDLPLERWYREMRIRRIGEGPSEVQRIVMARDLFDQALYLPCETRPPPLAGVTVVDLGQVYQGPYAALLMAKAGAEVIKVEPLTASRCAPRGGRRRRLLPLAMLNSNKRAITLNLKIRAGRAAEA